MFYLCVDLKTGTEIYTCLWQKWLEPGVNSDPIYQTNTGIDPSSNLFLKNWNGSFFIKLKTHPTLEKTVLWLFIIHNPENSGQFHFHHWTKGAFTPDVKSVLSENI
jgi:hypothetical protein